MLIQEAIRSGKKYRRCGDQIWQKPCIISSDGNVYWNVEAILPSGEKKDLIALVSLGFTTEEVLAEDWQVEE